MKIHKSLTLRKVLKAAEEAEMGTDNPGFCVACGHQQDGCEPDARKYICESCGREAVYGASELLMMMA